MLIVHGSNSKALAEKVSSSAGIPVAQLSLKKFPDGENYIRIDSDLGGRDVILLASMFPDQNSSLVELLLLADACGERGAKKITAIIPYFAYARQDKKFQDGEALSLKTVAGLFKAVGIEKIIVVDAHFHRKPGVFDFFGIPCTNISAAKILVDSIGDSSNFLVVGPDIASGEAVEFATGKRAAFQKTKICPACKKPATECRCAGTSKKYEVKGMESDINFAGKNVVILDDMITSGTTMIKAVEKVRREGANKVIAAATHGLFLKDSMQILQRKADCLIVTDTIETPVSRVSVARLINDAISLK